MVALAPLHTRVRIAAATPRDREAIYRLRHEVYARELGQHAENSEGRLTDGLDRFNHYVIASLGGQLAGFVSITPPGHGQYSIDKYVARDELPFAVDDGLYEVRLLTVAPAHRGRPIAGLLMYAALRWIESRGGARIMAIGRHEVLDMYRKVGLRLLGREVRSGAVRFELLTATTAEVRESLARYGHALRKVESRIDWQLDTPLYPAPDRSGHAGTGSPAGLSGRVATAPRQCCYHGGAFWEAIGDEFDALDRRGGVINADVLDAWFPPAPGVVEVLQRHLPFLLQTSPPTGCEGMIRTIARVRGVSPECLLPGAGSSDVIFQALRYWLRPSSRVLILDPMYGEYAHVLEQVIGCRVDRLTLSRSDGYQLNLAHLESRFANGYDLMVLVNPNSPTGRHVPRRELERLLAGVPPRTRVWIDETYVEYAGPGESLEQFAAASENIVVCKSMSKVYALSGVRAAYLCGPRHVIADLRPITPPWAVSLLAQLAAVQALQEPDYYAGRYRETHELREELIELLRARTALDIVPSVASFVLCHLPNDGPDADAICARCRARGLFVRNVANMGSQLGKHSLRIAVKDAETNRRVVDILTAALEQPDHTSG